MKRLLEIKPRSAFVIYLILDLICVAMGMGVPIFCILFGFSVGWYNAKVVSLSIKETTQIMRKLLFYAAVTSTFTFIVMAVLWGRWALILFESSTNYANLGIPMILFEPKASFIGWLILMIVIAPFLQLLTTLFGSVLTLIIKQPSNN